MERIGISYTHSNEVLQQTKEALAATLSVISTAIKENNVNEKIDGAISEPVFTR